MVLTLYKMDGSPPVRAVHMVISALKIKDVQYVEINLLTGDTLKESYTKMNPQHTVPTLTDDGFILWDSHAIALYLIRKFAKEDTLYPSDPKKRATIDQRLHFDSGVLFPALRRAVKPLLYFDAKSVAPEDVEEVNTGYDFAEKFLTSAWMAGDNVTVADICCVATISTMNLFVPIDSKRYPRLTAWLEKCSELDFYKEGNLPGLTQLKAIVKSKLG